MGGTAGTKRPQVDPAVGEFVNAVSDERRTLYDTLERIILGMYPDARIGISYGVPTYWAKAGRVGLAYWSGGVSFYPFGGDYLDEFRAKYPVIKTSKGTINLKVSDKVPVAALKKIFRQAIEHPHHPVKPPPDSIGRRRSAR
jgi:uncharacterized protein YdhG (YjbR/CyaY superfamily)